MEVILELIKAHPYFFSGFIGSVIYVIGITEKNEPIDHIYILGAVGFLILGTLFFPLGWIGAIFVILGNYLVWKNKNKDQN